MGLGSGKSRLCHVWLVVVEWGFKMHWLLWSSDRWLIDHFGKFWNWALFNWYLGNWKMGKWKFFSWKLVKYRDNNSYQIVQFLTLFSIFMLFACILPVHTKQPTCVTEPIPLTTTVCCKFCEPVNRLSEWSTAAFPARGSSDPPDIQSRSRPDSTILYARSDTSTAQDGRLKESRGLKFDHTLI